MTMVGYAIVISVRRRAVNITPGPTLPSQGEFRQSVNCYKRTSAKHCIGRHELCYGQTGHYAVSATTNNTKVFRARDKRDYICKSERDNNLRLNLRFSMAACLERQLANSGSCRSRSFLLAVPCSSEASVADSFSILIAAALLTTHLHGHKN